MALVTLAACNFTRVESLPAWPTATTVRVVLATPVATVDRPLRDVPTSQADEGDAVDGTCQSNTAEAMTSHIVIAEVDYAQRIVNVEQRIRYINRTEDVLAQVVMSIEPNSWPGAFSLEAVSSDDSVVNYELTGRRLEVDLPQALEPGCVVNLELAFRLAVPRIGDGADAYKGYFGYSPRQLNLGHWLPTVAVRVNHEWVTHDASSIGEQDVLDMADWDVTIHVTGALNTLQIAAPGDITETAPLRWHIVQTGARDLSLSMSETYNLSTQQLDNGIVVELYSFNDAVVQTDQGSVDSAAYALATASRALTLFHDVYGAYLYSRLVVVQADFPDGMELSGLVFVGGEYFRGFTGDPASYLTIITAHEISHQWWYAKVGNDQALSPWLDESLAAYSEYVFIEADYPELRDWWWEFRVDRLAPEGFVDSSVYEFSSIRAYINAVYLRGARMLRDLRSQLGDDAFFDWLHRYADAGAGRQATPGLFWSLLTPEQRQLTSATRQAYLRQPQIAVAQNP